MLDVEFKREETQESGKMAPFSIITTLVQKSLYSELLESPGKFVPKGKEPQESWKMALFSTNSCTEIAVFLNVCLKIPLFFRSKSRSCAEHPENFDENCAPVRSILEISSFLHQKPLSRAEHP